MCRLMALMQGERYGNMPRGEAGNLSELGNLSHASTWTGVSRSRQLYYMNAPYHCSLPNFNRLHNISAMTTKTTPTINSVHLRVNDGPLRPSDVALLRESCLSEPLDTLRERYATDGYLFIKSLLPRDDVLAARKAYFTSVSPSGVLKPGTAPIDGVLDPDAEKADFPGIGAGSVKNARPGTTDKAAVFTSLALQAHTDPWYLSFARHPALRDFVAAFTGWGESTLPIKRSLLRNNTPGSKAIGVHYDQSFMRHGEPTSVTAWVPIGDVRLDGGGLIYLKDSEALGKEIEHGFAEQARSKGMTDEQMKDAFNANMMTTGFLCDGPADFGRKYGRKWLVAEYEAGDVVFHTPHTVSLAFVV